MQESIRKRLAALEDRPFGSAPVGVLVPSGNGFELTHGTEKFFFQTRQEAENFFDRRTQNHVMIYWGRGTNDE